MDAPKRWYQYPGHIVTTLAIGASWVFSMRGAYQPELGWSCVQLVVLACISEASKFLVVRVMWKAITAAWWQRSLAIIWYLGCVGISVWLMHLNVSKNVAQASAIVAEQQRRVAAAEQGADAEIAKAEDRLKTAENALEEARSAIVPGVRPAAAIQAQLLAKGEGAPSSRERIQLERDLQVARANAQAAEKVERLKLQADERRESLLKSERDRSRTISARSPHDVVPHVPHVPHDRHELSAFGVVIALMLEIAVVGGVWADTLVGRSPAPETAPLPAPVPARTELVPAKVESFEAWLRAEWRRGRNKDGWLEGELQSWAAKGGFSKSFVHKQLIRLVKENKIEKKSSSRKTGIKFRKLGELNVVK